VLFPSKPLVLEDEAMVRWDVVSELEKAGFAVLEADTAERAIALVGDGQVPDLLLTDISLAGRRSGLDVTVWGGFARRPALCISPNGDKGRCEARHLRMPKPPTFQSRRLRQARTAPRGEANSGRFHQRINRSAPYLVPGFMRTRKSRCAGSTS